MPHLALAAVSVVGNRKLWFFSHRVYSLSHGVTKELFVQSSIFCVRTGFGELSCKEPKVR